MKPQTKSYVNKFILKYAALAGAALLFFGNSRLTALAYPAKLTLQPYYQGFYLLPDTESLVSMEDAATRLRYTVTNAYKEMASLAEITPVWTQNRSGNFIFAISENDLLHIRMLHNMGQEWCAINMPQIVPAGSTLDGAILACANWIADHMTYDDSAQKMLYNQNAVYGFRNREGVCATYTSMFNTMLDYLPFDPASGLVNYNCPADTANHINVQYLSNANHSWSAIRYPGGWSMFDITFYDADDGPRKPQYLWMSAATMMDGEHSGYDSLEYLESGSGIVFGAQ